eukprot:TRINITY_DN1391_c1_g2_i2.p1 TRINITY_DN1391_c1_g2~~TRINITY_DN1391_c1_g2_i2.p1  ORF type:complete len:119 (+),score=55.29 TRINITY_DN1391_c1_g2_i2:146-502(+)
MMLKLQRSELPKTSKTLNRTGTVRGASTSMDMEDSMDGSFLSNSSFSDESSVEEDDDEQLESENLQFAVNDFHDRKVINAAQVKDDNFEYETAEVVSTGSSSGGGVVTTDEAFDDQRA